MRHGRIWLYSLLLFVQTGGLAIILWQGTPVYRRILQGPEGLSAASRELILATLAVGLMQGAYWLRTAIIPSLTLSPNVFLRHIVLFVGRLSFIFGAALFTAVMYLRFPELERSIPRAAVLLAVLFSMFCYSLELAGITAKRPTESVNLFSHAKAAFVLAVQCNRWNDTGEIVPLIRPVPVRRRRRQYSARLSVVA